MSLPLITFVKTLNFVKVYPNFFEDRKLRSNCHKEGVSGVYLFFNLVTGSFYVGSSKNIYGRINNYLSEPCSLDTCK